MIKSRALILKRPGTAPVLTEIDVLDPGPRELRVRMAASGVCGTDGHAVEGSHPLPNLPVILGHEGAGVVESVGADVTGLLPGDHVVCALGVPCGACRQCVRGLAEHCNSPLRRSAMQGLRADGSTTARYAGQPAYPFFGVGTLSEYTTVRQEQVVKIPADFPLDEFCLTGCGVITAFGAVLNIARVSVGDTVAVVGCGGVGMNVIQAARIAGAAKIIAIDPVPEKLALAMKLGATHGVDPRHADGMAGAVAAIEPDGADVVFEVVGNPGLLAACISLTRVGGAVVMVGIPPAGSTLTLDGFTMTASRRLLGCRGGAMLPSRDTARLVSLYGSGQLQLGDLIGQRLPLDDVSRAFAALGSSTFARSVVIF